MAARLPETPYPPLDVVHGVLRTQQLLFMSGVPLWPLGVGNGFSAFDGATANEWPDTEVGALDGDPVW